MRTSWLLALTLCSCQSAPAQLIGPKLEVRLPPTGAGPQSTASPERLATKAACEGLAPCKLIALRAAYSENGTTRFVALVERGQEVYAPDSSARDFPLDHRFEDGADLFGATMGGCTQVEAWLMAADGERASRERLLTAICNDGHGAAGVGQDRLMVSDRMFTHDQNGGSAWRWSHSVSASLVSGLVSVSDQNGWVFGENSEEASFDYLAFRGKTTWAAPRCDPATPTGSHNGPALAFEYFVIPELDIDEAFASNGWQTTSLGTCATTLDGKNAGFLLGAGPSVASASIRAVAHAGTLYLEIDDDDWTRNNPRGDRVEIWWSEKGVSYFDHCLPPTRAPDGLEVRLDDGTVRRLQSSPEAPLVRARYAPAVTSGGPRRIALSFGKLPEALTFIYRDVDTGKPSRDIASSRIDTRDNATLGRFRQVPLTQLRCKTSGGSLQRVSTAIGSDAPLVDSIALPD